MTQPGSEFLRIAFESRVAVVTGAAGDIGWSIARGFRASGGRVALLDLEQGILRARVEETGDTDGYIVLPTDLCHAAQVEAAIEQVVRTFGRIDVVINNAASEAARGPLDQFENDAWQRTLSVNLGGAYHMSRTVIPVMRRQGKGVIVNIASQLGHVATAGSSAYSATKGGLISMTRAMALDHAHEGIRVVSLSPGGVMTSRLERLLGSQEGALAALGARHPLGRLGAPEDVANAALFLASDQAAFITGTDLLVDGGYTAQ